MIDRNIGIGLALLLGGWAIAQVIPGKGSKADKISRIRPDQGADYLVADWGSGNSTEERHGVGEGSAAGDRYDGVQRKVDLIMEAQRVFLNFARAWHLRQGQCGCIVPMVARCLKGAVLLAAKSIAAGDQQQRANHYETGIFTQ